MTDTYLPVKNIEIHHKHFKGDVTTNYLEHPITASDRRSVGAVGAAVVLPIEFRIPMNSFVERRSDPYKTSHCIVPYKYTLSEATNKTIDGGAKVLSCVLDERGMHFYALAKLIAKDLFLDRTGINIKAIRSTYIGVEVCGLNPHESGLYAATGWKVLSNIHAFPAGFSRNARQYLVDWLWQNGAEEFRIAPGELEVPGEEASWLYDMSCKVKGDNRNIDTISDILSSRWLVKTDWAAKPEGSKEQSTLYFKARNSAD